MSDSIPQKIELADAEVITTVGDTTIALVRSVTKGTSSFAHIVIDGKVLSVLVRPGDNVTFNISKSGLLTEALAKVG